jgi:hypothetical protein
MSRIEWSKDDAWAMDSALAPIIASGVRHFQKAVVAKRLEGDSAIGVPQLPGFDGNNILEDDDWERAWTEWQRRLDCIIYAFERHDDEPKAAEGAIQMDFDLEREDGTQEVVVTHPNEVAYKEWLEAREIHTARVKEGMELFALHFKSLWW